MQTASIQELKHALQKTGNRQIMEMCLQLARFKKDNKEYLSYLLFGLEAPDEYMLSVKTEMEEAFRNIRKEQVYLAKKTIRKVLRIANKHIRYIGTKEAGIEILTHFCLLLKNSGFDLKRSAVMLNLYNSQLKKIDSLLAGVHEDLQYDYQKQREQCSL